MSMKNDVRRDGWKPVLAAVMESLKPKPSRSQGVPKAALATPVTLLKLAILVNHFSIDSQPEDT
jgi:hypothetical protein